MSIGTPVWLRLNKVGCNMNRNAVEAVQDAGFIIVELKCDKVNTEIVPAAFPLRIIKGQKDANSSSQKSTKR